LRGFGHINGSIHMRKLTKKNWIVGLSALAIATVAGTAYAAQAGDGMTRTQVQTHATEMFAKMDANKDGKLDAADRAAHQTAMFDKLDGNKDGSISRDEFAAARPGPGGADGDSGHEMGGPGMGAPEGGEHRMGHGGRHGGMARGHGGMMGGGMGMHMLGMADANKDGAVTQAEFTSALLAHFDKADTNKDGTVSRDEHHAARAAMRPAS
jgi:EF hand